MCIRGIKQCTYIYLLHYICYFIFFPHSCSLFRLPFFYLIREPNKKITALGRYPMNGLEVNSYAIVVSFSMNVELLSRNWFDDCRFASSIECCI